ncbi:dystroglycan-like [Dorcoceras hygrometricum]|uniref:Dystroglycan-like n=1 Tax=Dorcoceras hygrometricum TaxID=472368 RepID=A0A2Z7CTE4_9LAMI|nr:dystroglycan-like [Dorcoceras hygrometricum]
MAASLIRKSLQINFDSVLSLSNEGMVSMFKTLESSGICGFLGCSAIIYEKYLVNFFENAIVRGNSVISLVQGVFVEFSEEQFAGVFEQPTEGLTSMNELPTDLITEVRRAFSASGEMIKTSCKKKEMKIEFRLMNDILAKTVTAKAGSFDAVTHRTFLLMAAIHGGIKINWSRFLFDILKEMKEKMTRRQIRRRNMRRLLTEDTIQLNKVLKLTETSVSDEESLPIDEILKQIPEDMMLPSTLAEEPTPIKFGRGIAFREVDWYKATLPNMDSAAKRKETLVEEIKGNPAKEIFSLISTDLDFLVQIRDAVLEEIATLFHSFSIRNLSALNSVSYLAAKEEQMLKWAETDSLQTTFQMRLYITAKYREMLLRKFLEARHQNFVSGTPNSAIDHQGLDLLSEPHCIALINLLEQLQLHKLKWTRPSSSNLFGGADVHSGDIHSQFYQRVSSTSWVRSLLFIGDSWIVLQGADPKPMRLAWPIISKPKKQLPQRPFVDAFAPICAFIEPVQDIDSRRPYSVIFQMNWAELVQMLFSVLFLDIYSQWISDSSPYSSPSSSSSSSSSYTSSSDSPIHFSEDHPQFDMPTTDFPSNDFTESTAQLRASIDQIQFEQVQTREHVEELKYDLSTKITKPELAFAQSTSRQKMVYRALFNDVQREVQIQKATLTQEMIAFHLETQEGLSTLHAQLSEIIAYTNRGRDDKKGEVSSSGPQPEDRSRPRGGGSRSEPSKRGGGSSEEDGVEVLDSVDGFLEKYFLFQFLYKALVLSCSD